VRTTTRSSLRVALGAAFVGLACFAVVAGQMVRSDSSCFFTVQVG